MGKIIEDVEHKDFNKKIEASEDLILFKEFIKPDVVDSKEMICNELYESFMKELANKCILRYKTYLSDDGYAHMIVCLNTKELNDLVKSSHH